MARITKDTAIRMSGLLQAIMSNPNIKPEDWPKKLEAACMLHTLACRKYEANQGGPSHGKAAEVVNQQN